MTLETIRLTDAPDQVAGDEEALSLPFPWPIRFPLAASGLYTWTLQWPPFRVPERIPERIPIPIPNPDPGPRIEAGSNGQRTGAADHGPADVSDTADSWLFPVLRETVRIDVDGRYPEMAVSGDMSTGFLSNVHWIANLTPTGPRTYAGAIWYRDPPTAPFPYTGVVVETFGGWWPLARTARITFSGPNITRIRTYKYASPYFHDVNLEIDFQAGESATTSLATCAHPNHPATLPCENLTIQGVFRRAGFNVSSSPGGPVPIAGAGANALWSNQEMHDAMQVYWSHFAPKAQWAAWVFFASTHEFGSGLGGIMFDDIGPQQRQGTAIFNKSFISNLPAGDPAPAAFVDRMRFWTAVHETGHAFNLAHAWQKSLTSGGHGPWIPLIDEPESRSFMNYPYNVSGGTTAFFSDFEYRFSDQELLFLRHAPPKFVEQGNALWFDNHGFQAANALPEPTFALVVRVNRDRPVFEFLEPITIELKLINASTRPQVVSEHILDLDQDITVITKKEGSPSRQILPFARYCLEPTDRVLVPGEAIYAPLLASVGKNGWDLATPGNYSIQICLHLPSGEDIVSNELKLQVAPPKSYEDELLAQDFFTDNVGRVLTFEGTRVLHDATDTLTEIAEKLPHRRVAAHANLVLGNALAKSYMTLVEDSKDKDQPFRIKTLNARPDEAKERLTTALTAAPEQSAETFGHVRFKETVDRMATWLAAEGETKEAYKQEDILLDTLAAREVHGRKVLDSVLEEVKATRDSFAPRAGSKAKAK
jgi:hypothetical protein